MRGCSKSHGEKHLLHQPQVAPVLVDFHLHSDFLTSSRLSRAIRSQCDASFLTPSLRILCGGLDVRFISVQWPNFR